MAYVVTDYGRLPVTKNWGGASEPFIIEVEVPSLTDNTQLIEEVKTYEIESLSPVEIEDIKEGMVEIREGKAKKFENVDEALKWLKED